MSIGVICEIPSEKPVWESSFLVCNPHIKTWGLIQYLTFLSGLNLEYLVKYEFGNTLKLRLSKTLGRSPESWLTMQNKYNLWHTKKRLNLEKVEKLNVVRERKNTLVKKVKHK